MQFPGTRLSAYMAWKLQNTFEFTISTPTGRFSPVGFLFLPTTGRARGRQTIIEANDDINIS